MRACDHGFENVEIIILMFRILLLVLELQVTMAYEVMFALNCGSFSYTMISTKYFNYTVDTFFQGLASAPETKTVIPESIVHQSDRELIKTHRTTAQGYQNFSYRPILTDPGYYLAIITMIQTDYKNKGDRIFHIKLGDQVVHTVDLVAESGYGKILHKWIEMDIRDDVAYLNGTMPALNAFNFKTRQVRIVFESVKNKAKIQSIAFIKGTDSHQYLKQFLQYELEKSIKVKEYISEKYRRQPKLSYRPLLATDIIPEPESELRKLYDKFINLRSFSCILCGIFSIHYEKILEFIKLKIRNVFEKIKSLKNNMFGKKKKE